MKLKLENKLDDAVLKHIAGGTLEVSHEMSADEMECFPAPRTNCVICGGTNLAYKFYVVGDNAHCRLGQECLNGSCGYKWTFGANLEYEP